MHTTHPNQASLRAAHFDGDLTFLCKELLDARGSIKQAETVRPLANVPVTRNLGCVGGPMLICLSRYWCMRARSGVIHHTYTTPQTHRELLLPPKLAAKAPPDLKASVELLRQILDGGLQLDPTKRLTPTQALALFGGK